MDIVDSLVVTLGLDATNYTQGQTKALTSLRRTSDEATSAAKNMQARGAQAAEFFSKVRNEALGLLTVLVGGKGLEAFTRDAVNGLSDLGRAAHDIGIGVPQLAALRNMIAANGGSADAAAASFQNLAQAMARARTFGPSPELAMFLSSIGASGNDSVDTVYSKFNVWAQGRNPEDVILRGQMGGLDIGTIREAEKPVAQFRKDMADAMNRGVASQAMTKDMQALQSSFIKAEQAATNLGNQMLDKLAPALTVVLDIITTFIEKHPNLAAGAAAGAAAGGGILSWLGLRSLFGGGGAATGAAGGAAAAGGTGAAGLLGWLGLAGAASYLGFHVGGAGESPGDLARMRREHPLTGPALGRMPPNTKGRAKQAYDYFLAQGWTKDQAAALTGNIRGESGFDQTQIGDNGDAVGIGQWHADRVAKIKAGTGIDVRTASYADQLRAMQWELTHTEAGAGIALRKTTGISDASYALTHHYERSKNQFLDSRIRAWYASGYALDFANLAPGSVPGTSHGALATSGPAGNTSSSQMHIGQITIHTQATDAGGIAKDIGTKLRDYGFVAQANMGIF